MPSMIVGAGTWTGRGWHLEYSDSHGESAGVSWIRRGWK